MIIGVLREIKDNEYRVALTPAGAQALVGSGHCVVVEAGAGDGSGMSDEQFQQAGAEISSDRSALCSQAGLILKIKEPLPAEYHLFKPGQMLFTFFHLASSRQLTEALLRTGATCIAYETVAAADGRVPLLEPMSVIAGRMAPLVAAQHLARPAGGKGVLASACGDMQPARFLILGGGTAGQAAAGVALGMGASVTIVEKSETRLASLQRTLAGAVCLPATPETIADAVRQADVIIGTVHVPGARTPRLITAGMLATMEQGSVVVDVAIDQGGCFETSRPTTHSNPVFVVDGIIHYCVANMPGIFPRTATLALTSATLPYVLELARKGEQAFANPELLAGLNLYKGMITNREVAKAHGLPYTDPKTLLPAAYPSGS
jgi:alanine dehydrogenase